MSGRYAARHFSAKKRESLVMENGIRAGILVFNDDKLLLVKQFYPEDGFTWWVVPGGRVEEDETILECAERETLEETSLEVKAGRVIYLRQYIDRPAGINSIEIFLTCDGFEGSVAHKKQWESENIEEVGFFTRQETEEMNVLPPELKKHVWLDYDVGFPSIKFLGIRAMKMGETTTKRI